MSEKDAITLGADVGGKDADAATHEDILSLRIKLRQRCPGPYGEVIEEFALILRIDGSVQAWGKSGVENVVLNRRHRYATADIFVPRDVWSGADATVFRRFLAAQVRAAIDAIASRASRRKVELTIDALRRDVDSAIREWAATRPE